MYDADFLRAVKFTLAHEGKALATSLGMEHFLDLDDTVNNSKILASDAPSIVWRMATFDPDPFDPLYLAAFVMGAKTTSDPSNYDMLGFIGEVTKVFQPQSEFVIMDWSGDVTPTQRLGSMFITASGVDQQMMDVQSGIRLVGVEARLVRFV